MELITDDIDFEAYMSEPEARQKVRPASSYADEIAEHFAGGHRAHGVMLPWNSTSELFRLRPNELTLWPGINGHGKSLLLGQVMNSAMDQGEKVLIASMEMMPAATASRMCCQYTDLEAPNREEISAFLRWTDEKLWIYDHLGSIKWRRLLGVLRYCADKLGITQFVIDSLMRCGIADDDYSGQKEFVDALCTFKMDYPVHVHLVLHSRKLQDESQLPGKFDVKGNGTLTDLTDNIATVWRNKAKEAAQMRPSHERTDRESMAANGPDGLLIIDKQRHWEWEGKIPLWYKRGSMRFTNTEYA